jgi:hypothetical protein
MSHNNTMPAALANTAEAELQAFGDPEQHVCKMHERRHSFQDAIDGTMSLIGAMRDASRIWAKGEAA